MKNGETAIGAYNKFITNNDAMYMHHEKLMRMMQAQKKIKQINEHRQADQSEGCKQNDATDHALAIPADIESAMHDFNEVQCDKIDEQALADKIKMLNSDQTRIFNRITKHLQHQRLHEVNECNCADRTPLHMFISGVGGTGKSFLIDVIKHEVARIFKDDESKYGKCAIACPTGLAAHQLKALTCHRLFRLPVEHDGKSPEYFRLPTYALKQMCLNLSAVRIVIIDETLMVSNLTLAYIHRRLDDLFGGVNPKRKWGSDDEWFGSINMLFFGDLLQLPPVNAQPIFCPLSNTIIASRLECLASENIWNSSVKYDELTINERQKSDGEFSTILDEVRKGFPSKASLDQLNSRVIKDTAKECFTTLVSMGKSPLCLFPTCKACRIFNMEMIEDLNTQVTKFLCIDEVDETTGRHKWTKTAEEQLKKLNKDCNLTAGLESELTIAVGARIMLRRNLETSKGLVNGSLGIVESYSSQKIMVKFDNIPEIVGIERIKGHFMLK